MSEENQIRVLIANVDEDLKVESKANSLESLQEAVGGYVEAITLTDRVVIWMNEEGKLHGLPVNFAFVKNSKIVDTANGNIVFTGYDSEGENVSLTDEDIEAIESRFFHRKGFRVE